MMRSACLPSAIEYLGGKQWISHGKQYREEMMIGYRHVQFQIKFCKSVSISISILRRDRNGKRDL